MAWELVAIWIIVAATIVWFVRDERRQNDARLNERARAYATGSAWRHRSAGVQTRPLVDPDQRDLTDIQRRFIEEMRRVRAINAIRN